MVINLPPELEAALSEEARRQKVAPEVLALDALLRRFLPEVWMKPRDEWERRLLAMGRDCGVSLSNEALGREEMYD